MLETLQPGKVTLKQLESIYWGGANARLDPSYDTGIERAAARVAEIEAGDTPVLRH